MISLSSLMLTLLVLSFKEKCEEKEGKNTRFPVLWRDTESELRFQGIPLKFRDFRDFRDLDTLHQIWAILTFSVFPFSGKSETFSLLLFHNPCLITCQLVYSFVCFREVQSYTLQDI